MRVLIANYRYFVSGGPERYMFGVTDELTARGHQVVPFSVDYAQNHETPYSKYFARPLGDRDEVYFRSHRKSLSSVGRTLARAFYDPDVADRVGRLVGNTNPDLAYVLHYLRKLSPALLVGLKRASVPIIVRLSDYMMLCPQAHFLRDSAPCQKCMHGSLLHSVRYRCVQNSISASLVNAAATWFHRRSHYFDLIDAFAVTNQFMYQTMVEAGYSEKRLRLIPTFVNTDTFRPCESKSEQSYVAFVGRLEHIKGVHVLLEAVGRLQSGRPDVGWIFKVAGTGDDEYVATLRIAIDRAGLSGRVDLVGNLTAAEVPRFLAEASLQVLPSISFENLPNSLLEGYACGLPVVASDTGSLSGAVIDGVTGYKFVCGSAEALAMRLASLWDNPGELRVMGQQARKVAMDRYSRHAHMSKLEALFEEVTGT